MSQTEEDKLNAMLERAVGRLFLKLLLMFLAGAAAGATWAENMRGSIKELQVNQERMLAATDKRVADWSIWRDKVTDTLSDHRYRLSVLELKKVSLDTDQPSLIYLVKYNPILP